MIIIIIIIRLAILMMPLFCVFSEPNNFVCGTCKSTFSSAWFLLQHVQNVHGLKIYIEGTVGTVEAEEAEALGRPKCPDRPESSDSAAARKKIENGTSEVDKKIDEEREREISRDREREKERERERETKREFERERELDRDREREREHEQREMDRERVARHQAQARSAMMPPTSMDSLQPPHPFMFRMPMAESQRQPLSPHAALNNPFSRPPGSDLRMDFINNPFERMHLPVGPTPAFEPPHAAFPFGERPPRPGLAGLQGLPGLQNLQGLSAIETAGMLDFYSQRLRQLAGTSTSPSPSPSPARKQQGTPPFSQSANSAFTGTGSSVDSAKTSPVQPAKLKACEFCGKCFRFQSNLIVHRRSHTGEKPFKCPLCPHACTQASKLKRHMKTHKHKSSMSSNMSDNNSTTSSTPDSNKLHGRSEDSNLDEDEDEDDLDDEEEEEEEDEEEEMEEEEEEPTDLSQTEDPADMTRLKKPRDYLYGENESSQEPTDLSVGHVKGSSQRSLLSEVMEHTGLNSIAQYSEAFQQALEESGRKLDLANKEEITENGVKNSESHSKERSLPTTSQPNAIGDENEQYYKRIKLEPQDHQDQLAAFYSSIWFPPTQVPPRDLFAASTTNELDKHHRNGVTPPESAFKVTGHSPNPTGSHNSTPTLGTPTMPTSSPSPGREGPVKRRNDQCEFCGKIFKNCSNLTVHRRSHTGEKPYKCYLCSYACAQSSKLTRHMKTHGRHGKDVYRCKFCSMPFSVPSTLEKHMRKCVENQSPNASGVQPLQETDTDNTSTSTTMSTTA